MNKVLKLLRNLVIGVWIIVSLFVTVCLLSYNDFNITVFGKNTWLIIDNDELEPEFKEGSLTIVKKQSDSKIEIGDKVFFYNDKTASQFLINVAEITDKDVRNGGEAVYQIDDYVTTSEYIIGKADEAKVIENLGTILGIFESRWGFLFLVVLPTLFAVVYEVVMVIDESKKKKKEA